MPNNMGGFNNNMGNMGNNMNNSNMMANSNMGNNMNNMTKTEYSQISTCRDTQLGETYIGTVQHTALGYPCEFWVNIHKTSYKDDDFPDGSVHAAMNFCRNPSGDEEGRWCYTIEEDVIWQWCGIPMCDMTDNLNNIYIINHYIYLLFKI